MCGRTLLLERMTQWELRTLERTLQLVPGDRPARPPAPPATQSSKEPSRELRFRLLKLLEDLLLVLTAWIQGLFGALEPGGSGGVVGGSLLWQGCSASGFLRGELSLPQNCCKVQIKKFLKSNLQTNWKSQISFLSALFKRPPRMRWLYYVLCTSHSHMILTRMENMSRMASHIFWGWWCWSSRRGRWWKRGWSTSRSSTRNLLRAIRNVHTSVNTLVCCIEFIVSICRLHKLWAEVKYKWSEFDQHSQLENIHLAELIN